MAHCPVCNIDVDNLEEHSMDAAQMGDRQHQEAIAKMEKKGTQTREREFAHASHGHRGCC